MSRERIPADVRKRVKELAQARPMRRGSVSERFMKCGQKECRCQHDQQARHGPVLQRHAGRRREDAVAVSERRTGRAGPPASRGGPGVPETVGTVLAGLRAVGRCPTRRLRGRLARGGQKKGFKMAFEVETVTEIEALLGTGVDDDWDFEAIEMAARRMAMRVAARAVEQRLNDDTSDHAGPDVALRVRSVGALRRPAWQELRERAGVSEAGARLLLLRTVRRGLLSA